MPIISVIVPVYKVEPYLRRCVDSILAQSFSDFELLLVDDGSPDNCGMICDEYSKRDARVIVIHKQNGGVSSARNAGLKACTGTFVAFCDSDDYVGSDWLLSLFNASMNSGADLVCADYVRVSGSKHFHAVNSTKGYFAWQRTEDRINFLITSILQYKIGWEVWTKLFSAQIIRNNMIRFCETCENFAEDMGFVIEYILCCNTLVTCDEAAYYYCINNESMMARSANKVRLNSMNEISFLTYQRIKQSAATKKVLRVFPVIHYLIMNNQYSKIVLGPQYDQLGCELKRIKRKSWFRRQTAKILGARSMLEMYFGRNQAQKIMLLSTYCLHRKWSLHKYMSAVFYKFIYRED